MPAAAAMIGVPGAATRSTPSCMNRPPLAPGGLKPPKLRLGVGLRPMAMPSAVGLFTVLADGPIGLGPGGLESRLVAGLVKGDGAVWGGVALGVAVGAALDVAVLGCQLACGHAPVPVGPGPTIGPIGTVRAHGWSNGSARSPNPDVTEM